MPDADGTQQVYDIEALNALAGVISGDLVRSYPKAMTTDEACVETERDSTVPTERGEVVVAAWLLVGLAIVVASPGLAKRIGISLAREEGLELEPAE